MFHLSFRFHMSIVEIDLHEWIALSEEILAFDVSSFDDRDEKLSHDKSNESITRAETDDLVGPRRVGGMSHRDDQVTKYNPS